MSPSRPTSRGYTLIEMMVVLAVMGVIVAIALPSMTGSRLDQQLKDTARSIGGALALARSEAIRTGDVQIVFVGTDAAGNPLLDGAGNPVLALVLDDGPPGSAGQNCQIDAGEPVSTVPAAQNVTSGVLAGVVQVPSDLGAGDVTTGSTFTEPGGAAATWVLFRPEGTPHSFDAACTVGATGSGAGGLYLHNADRQYAVVLRPLGGMHVVAWDVVTNGWVD